MIDKAADLIWRRFNKPEGGASGWAAKEEEQAPAGAKEDKPAEEPKPKAEPEPKRNRKNKEAKPQKEPAVASKAEEKKRS